MDPSSIDPNTAIGAGLMALASKDLLNRLLGPSADYIGGEIRGLVAKCNINLNRIFGHAVKKLGRKIEQPGAVNSRVLKQVWSEGAFVEDELAAEYFGGLLASARTPDGRDDRALSLLSTVRDLSVYDLRLHYLVYQYVRSQHLGKRIDLSGTGGRLACFTAVPFRTCAAALGVGGSEIEIEEAAHHSLFTLLRYDLVDENFSTDWQLKPKRSIEAHLSTEPERAIKVYPSYVGAKLFLWAHGHSDKRIDQIFDPSIDLPGSAEMPVAPEVTPSDGVGM